PSFCSSLICAGTSTLSLPLGPCTSTLPPLTEEIFTPAGTGIGLRPIRDIVSLSLFPECVPQNFAAYQISQRISPPTLVLRAERPVITPFGVVRMLMPRPPTTGRTSREPR